MGQMIPDACPPKATAGEKRLFSLFRNQLPNDFWVWYEPSVKGRHPDFVLLADTFGLLLVEVKGWLPNQIVAMTDTEATVSRTEGGASRCEVQPNPLRQVREYQFALIDRLKREAVLRHPAGPHEGKLTFPVGHLVVFPHIPRAAAGEWAGLFPPAQVMFKDELESLVAADSDRDTIARLARAFDPRFLFDPLAPAQVAAVRRVLHPEAEVGRDRREVLTAQQEQLAKEMGGGHRVFAGVAGSGKTILLLARARWLTETDPDKRVLLLCFNRPLGTSLRHTLSGKDGRRFDVFSFHAWGRAVTRLHPYPGEEFEDYESRLVPALLHATANMTDADRYDAVLVDEGQDFQPDWFRCCVQAVRSDPPGDLLIAVDGAQSLYNRPRSFTWKSVGVNAVGRTRVFKRNFRNTREILALAWTVAQQPTDDPPDGGESEDEPIVRLKPDEGAVSGPTPQFRRCRSEAEERAVVAGLVRGFLEDGFAAEDIAVLYPKQGGNRVTALAAELSRTADVVWITDRNNPAVKDRYPGLPGVRLLTLHSAKGLEFRGVVVSGLDQLAETDGNLLYVGLTRAMDRLALTSTGGGVYVDRIARSGLVSA